MKRKKGFTIVELIIVISVLSILITYTSTVGVKGMQRGQQTEFQLQCQVYEVAISEVAYDTTVEDVGFTDFIAMVNDTLQDQYTLSVVGASSCRAMNPAQSSQEYMDITYLGGGLWRLEQGNFNEEVSIDEGGISKR